MDVRAEPREVTVADLARNHGQALVNCAYLLCRDPELAKDAVQDVLTRLHSRDLSTIEHLGAYLRRAVVNEVNSHLRRRQVLQRAVLRLPIKTTYDDPADLVVERQALWPAFGLLSPRQRAALVLRYYEDLDDVAIAEILECSPATVRTLVSRALKRLRQQLAEGSST